MNCCYLFHIKHTSNVCFFSFRFKNLWSYILKMFFMLLHVNFAILGDFIQLIFIAPDFASYYVFRIFIEYYLFYIGVFRCISCHQDSHFGVVSKHSKKNLRGLLLRRLNFMCIGDWKDLSLLYHQIKFNACDFIFAKHILKKVTNQIFLYSVI